MEGRVDVETSIPDLLLVVVHRQGLISNLCSVAGTLAEWAGIVTVEVVANEVKLVDVLTVDRTREWRRQSLHNIFVRPNRATAELCQEVVGPHVSVFQVSLGFITVGIVGKVLRPGGCVSRHCGVRLKSKKQASYLILSTLGCPGPRKKGECKEPKHPFC
jgi:hypothetical protein